MIKLIQSLLLAGLSFTLTFGLVKADELNLDKVDKTYYLLGMIDMPRLKSSDETLNQIFSYYTFNNKVSAENFINIAKSIGIDDTKLIVGIDLIENEELKKDALTPTYFVESKQLEALFKPFITFTNVDKSNKDKSFNASRVLSLRLRYSYPIYNYITENKIELSALLDTITEKGYPNLLTWEREQQLSFLLGLIATRATVNTEPNTSGSIPHNYNLGFLRILTTYQQQIDTLFDSGLIDSPSRKGETIFYDNVEVSAYQWGINIPKDYENAVIPLIEQRQANKASELQGFDGYTVRTYDAFVY